MHLDMEKILRAFGWISLVAGFLAMIAFALGVYEVINLSAYAIAGVFVLGLLLLAAAFVFGAFGPYSHDMDDVDLAGRTGK